MMFFKKKDKSIAELESINIGLAMDNAYLTDLYEDIKKQLGHGINILETIKSIKKDREEVAEMRDNHNKAIAERDKQLMIYKNRELEEQIKGNEYKIEVGVYNIPGELSKIIYVVNKKYVAHGQIYEERQGDFKTVVIAQKFITECKQFND